MFADFNQLLVILLAINHPETSSGGRKLTCLIPLISQLPDVEVLVIQGICSTHLALSLSVGAYYSSYLFL